MRLQGPMHVVIFTAMLSCILSDPARSEPSNQQLVIATTQEIETLNPLMLASTASNYESLMVNRPLVTIDAQWAFVCSLCEKLPTFENKLARIADDHGKKKLVTEWQLKRGLRWGDGTPVTARDILLAWEIGRATHVNSPAKEAFERIESVQIDGKDAAKFVLTFAEVRYDYYQQTSLVPVPSHIERAIWERTKGQPGAYEKQTTYATAPTTAGLYSGPYVVGELNLGHQLTLRRSSHFFGSPPQIEKIILRSYSSPAAVEAALLAGEADMASELSLSMDQAQAFEKKVLRDEHGKDRFKTWFQGGMTYEHVVLNQRQPALADKRVRQALLLGLDRKKLLQALFAGKIQPAKTWVHPLDPNYASTLLTYDYDMKKAGSLLDQAGWTLAQDGLRYREGKRLDLVLMSTSGNKAREAIEQFMQGELRKIGVLVVIRNEPARVFFADTIHKGLFPAMALFASTPPIEAAPKSTFYSKEIPTRENNFNGQNVGSWAHKRVDEILDQLPREMNSVRRKSLMTELQQIYAEEVPAMPLFLRADVVIAPSKLENLHLTGHYFYSTQAIESWSFGGQAH